MYWVVEAIKGRENQRAVLDLLQSSWVGWGCWIHLENEEDRGRTEKSSLSTVHFDMTMR